MTRTTGAGLYGSTAKGFKMRDMQKRRQIIEDCDASMVISIHQNTCALPSRRGSHVFFDKDSAGGRELAPALKARGIRLLRTPEFEVRYVGFNFADPRLGGNLALRRALSLAYDVQRRVEHTNYQLIPAQGPIPPMRPASCRAPICFISIRTWKASASTLMSFRKSTRESAM